MKELIFDPTMLAMGATEVFDYSGEGHTISHRLGRCYELAVKAFYPSWSMEELDERGFPRPKTLVHGIWSSPETRDNPIYHAWVILSDKRVWEPITAGLYEPGSFASYTEAQVISLYDAVAARRTLLRYQHYGPWGE